jgi:hypothetical protein
MQKPVNKGKDHVSYAEILRAIVAIQRKFRQK